MNALTRFLTDRNKIKEGSWIVIGTDSNDGLVCRLKIKRISPMSNPRFSAKYNALLRKQKDGVFSSSQWASVREAYVDEVLVDWENMPDPRVESKNDVPTVYMPFNRANAIALLEESDVFEFITNRATEIETFQSKQDEDDAKN